MNLSGSNIQDTYQRVLHTNGASITDGTGSEVLSAAELTSLQTIGSANITSTEWLEIAKIGSADISEAEWGYVAGMQEIRSTSTVEFSGITLNSVYPITSAPSLANSSGRAGFAFETAGNTTDINIVQDRLVVGAFKANGDISCSGNLIFDTIDGGTF